MGRSLRPGHPVLNGGVGAQLRDQRSQPDTRVAVYRYNGLHWRVVHERDTSHPIFDTIDERCEYFYDAEWRMVEEWVDHDDTNPYENAGANTAPDGTVNRRGRQFWGLRYIDDAVARQIDRNGDDDWTNDAGLYFYLTDGLFSVRALWDATDGRVEEWVDYDAYGEPHQRLPEDLTHDGVLNFSDVQGVQSAVGNASVRSVDTDLDADGDTDADDLDPSPVSSPESM